jgi:hypothetical protein
MEMKNPVHPGELVKACIDDLGLCNRQRIPSRPSPRAIGFRSCLSSLFLLLFLFAERGTKPRR